MISDADIRRLQNPREKIPFCPYCGAPLKEERGKNPMIGVQIWKCGLRRRVGLAGAVLTSSCGKVSLGG